jgi:uncharacterized membrane protein YfhO
LKTSSAAPGVLLLNDHHDPAWEVFLDGKPEKLLRANFIMRGAQVPAGQHTVVFQFEPSLTGMKVTLTAVIVGLLFCGYLFMSRGASSDEPGSALFEKPIAKPGAARPGK